MKASRAKKYKILSNTVFVLSCLLAFSLLGNLLPRALSFEMEPRVIGTSGTITYSQGQALLKVFVIETGNTPEGSIPFKVDGSSIHPNGTEYWDGDMSYSLAAGNHTIEMPSPWTSPYTGTTYFFSFWGDGSTDNPRTTTFEADETYSFQASYAETEPTPPPPPPTPSEALYSFVHVTDTQHLAQYYPDNLNGMFSYLESIKTEYNIKWISFSGDCVQNWGSDYEWNNFLYARSLTSIPVEIVAGNHDNNWGTNFYWYDQYIGSEKQYYYTIHEDFIGLYISWFGSANIMDGSMISYFQDAIASNPTKIPLIVTHYYMNVDGSLVSLAYQIQNNGLVQSPVSIVLCGHMHNSFSNTRTVDGTTVYEFMTNYQDDYDGAYARIFIVYEGQFTERVLRIRPEPISWVTEEKSYSLPEIA